MAPLVQSTGELPRGPLTLRVYAGADCAGSLYQDDGVSNAYQNGGYLRMTFTCERDTQSLRVHIGPQQGSFAPWWSQIYLDIFGFTPSQEKVLFNGTEAFPHIDHNSNSIGFLLPYDGKEMDIRLK